MKQVLRDAILAAFNAGYKQALSEDDRLSDVDRKNHREKSNDFSECAWVRLATLPGDVGDAARAELARMKGEN